MIEMTKFQSQQAKHGAWPNNKPLHQTQAGTDCQIFASGKNKIWQGVQWPVQVSSVLYISTDDF